MLNWKNINLWETLSNNELLAAFAASVEARRVVRGNADFTEETRDNLGDLQQAILHEMDARAIGPSWPEATGAFGVKAKWPTWFTAADFLGYDFELTTDHFGFPERIYFIGSMPVFSRRLAENGVDLMECFTPKREWYFVGDEIMPRYVMG